MTPEQLEQVWRRARCLYDRDAVEAALDRMAEEIRAAVATRNPILCCIMHGGLIVSGALAVRLPFPLQMDYLHATRYREKTSGSDLHWLTRPTRSLADRVVVLVDDVLDEGHTLAQVRAYCLEQRCAQVYRAVLVEKKSRHREAAVTADFVGLTAEDYYLFGYGMDYQGYLRNAPGIYAIDDADR